MKRDVRKAIVPILGCSIAIAYGGSAVTFSMIAVWPLLARLQPSLAVGAWALDAVLGAILLVTAFLTLLRSNRARRVLVCTLFVTLLFELVRAHVFFPSMETLPSDDRNGALVVAILLISTALVMSRSSTSYTDQANRTD